MAKAIAKVLTTDGSSYTIEYTSDGEKGFSATDIASITEGIAQKIPQDKFVSQIEAEGETRSASPSPSVAVAPNIASSPAVRLATPSIKAPAVMKFETNGESPKKHDKEWYPVVCRNLAHQMVELYGDPVTALAWVERHADDWAYTVEYTNKQDSQKYSHTIGNIKNGVRAALEALAAEGAVSSKVPEAMEYQTGDKRPVKTSDVSLLIGKPFEKNELEELLTKLKSSPSKEALEALKTTYPSGLVDALNEKLKKDKNYALSEGDVNKFRNSHLRFLSEDEVKRLKDKQGDLAAQFLACIGQATSTSNFLNCLTDSSIPNMANQEVIDGWKDSTIVLNGEKKVIDDPEIDAVIGAILKRNGKVGDKMANSFVQISNAIRRSSDPEWIRARIKSLIPKDGVSREDIAAQTKYDMELRTLLAEMKEPGFTDKTKLTPTKIQMITRIMQAYFKVKNIKVKWDEAATYNAIALYKNIVAAYTHSTNGTIKNKG